VRERFERRKRSNIIYVNKTLKTCVAIMFLQLIIKFINSPKKSSAQIYKNASFFRIFKTLKVRRYIDRSFFIVKLDNGQRVRFSSFIVNLTSKLAIRYLLTSNSNFNVKIEFARNRLCDVAKIIAPGNKILYMK
jgi:hypothetical protein